MPVRKFRSVSEMPGPPARLPLDPENIRIAVELMDLSNRFHPLRRMPGVRKFGSLDEALRAKAPGSEDWS